MAGVTTYAIAVWIFSGIIMPMAIYAHFTKVFIPRFSRIPKTDFPDFPFVVSLEDWNKRAHVLSGLNLYWVCFSKDENVSYCPIYKLPLGYAHPSLEKATQFVAESRLRQKDESENPFNYVGYKRKPPSTMSFVNVKTGEVVNYTTLEKTCAKMHIASKTVSRAIREKWEHVSGWNIIR